MTTAFNRARTELNLVEMEDQRLKDMRPAEELMEVTVDVQSEDLNSTHSYTRPLIQDRDPKGINKSLKVTSEHCHWGLINISLYREHTAQATS